ncbi:MAG: hypothetical protein JSV51_01290 [Candidatus Bathyarchaeota archaeon]|nr:MAG: hypothetical protein JSV51_01290 [Candidatus Bathyarchaeota archaeon]
MRRRRVGIVGGGLLIIILIILSVYFHEFLREDIDESWLKPGSYVIYEQFFVWDENSEVDYMAWNVTKLWNGFIDLHLRSHGVNITGLMVELTVGDANLTADAATRKVVNGSDIVAYYIDKKWPFWIETNVTTGSTVDIWYGVTTIIGNDSIYVLGQQRNCWIIQYNWPSGSMKRWYDESSGILLKIHNVLYRQGFTIVVTETAVMTNIDSLHP